MPQLVFCGKNLIFTNPFSFTICILYIYAMFCPHNIHVYCSQTLYCNKYSVDFFCSVVFFLFITNFSIYSPFSLSLLFLYAVCCRQLSGCTAKSNSLSYSSSHAVSYNSGCATSSVFSPWICGKDCNLSEVSWSDSLRFLPLSFFSF